MCAYLKKLKSPNLNRETKVKRATGWVKNTFSWGRQEEDPPGDLGSFTADPPYEPANSTKYNTSPLSQSGSLPTRDPWLETGMNWKGHLRKGVVILNSVIKRLHQEEETADKSGLSTRSHDTYGRSPIDSLISCIYNMIHNSIKITKHFMVGGHHSMWTVLKGHSIRRVERNCGIWLKFRITWCAL